MANRYGLLDQSYNTGTTAQSFRQAAANTAIGQTFTAGVTKKLTWASVYFNTRVGTPTGNVYLELYNSDFSALLATSDVIASASITAAALNAFVFSTPYSMTATTVYGLVVRGSWTIDGSNYFTLYRNTSSGYAGGSMFLYNGSTWADQSLDMRFNVFSNADGGFFDLDTSVATSVLRTTIKGAAIAATDVICCYNGMTYTEDEAYSRAQVHAGKSVGATGTTVADATSGQRSAIIIRNPGVDCVFGGSATAIQSGYSSLLTAADATSKNSVLQIGTPTGARCADTNAGNAVDTSQKWTVNWPNGQVNIQNWDMHNTYQAPFTVIAMDSSKTAGAPIAKNITMDGFIAGSAGINIITCPVANIDLVCDFSNISITWLNNTSASGPTLINMGSTSLLASGGKIIFKDFNISLTNTAPVYPILLRTDASANRVYFGNGFVAFNDLRNTQVIPTGLALTNPGTGGELRFTITNAASYAAVDEIVIYNSTGDTLMACIPISRYNSLGYGIIAGLTDGASYTVYPKATSDNSTYSAAGATATGTPTLAATDPSFVALEATRNTLTVNGEADVSLNKTWQYRGTTKTGSLVVASATAPTIEDIKNITSTSAIIVTGFASNATTYKVYKNGVLVASGQTAVEYALSGLSPNTTYSITLVGTGLSGDSSPSTAYVFTTLASEAATDVAALSTHTVAVVPVTGAPKIVGSGTVKVFDPRVIANAISQATADYYWKDIQENNGKSVLPGA
jgi:hypothetical protein